MYWTTRSIVFGRAFIAKVLAAIKVDPVTNLVVAPKLRLSGDPDYSPVPDSGNVALRTNEAAFTGYTAGGYVPVFSDPVNLSGNQSALVASVMIVAGTADPQVTGPAYGWWLEDTTMFVCGERFPPGVQAGFTLPGDFLQLDLVIPLPLIVALAPISA